MSVGAGEILPALEALEVARFKRSADGKQVLGLVGLDDAIQPLLVNNASVPADADYRPDGAVTIYNGVVYIKSNGAYIVGSPSVAVSVTASRVAAISDSGKVLECDSVSAINVTIPPASSTDFPDGSVLTIYQVGSGASLFAAGAGVTIQGTAPTPAQFVHIAVRKRAGDTWAWV